MKNIVGARVTQARMEQGMKQVELLAQLQLAGVDMSIPALSLLEGQKRPVSDKELCALGRRPACVGRLAFGKMNGDWFCVSLRFAS